MNEVSFATNADKPQDIVIMVNTSGEMLKTSPKFDRVGKVCVAATADGAETDRAMLKAPAMQRDGVTAPSRHRMSKSTC